MATYEITAEMNLKKIIVESMEVAQALNEFADRLTEIDKKYSDDSEKDGEWMTDTEVMQVLSEIADDCYYRMHCGECKFDKKGRCMLKGIPADWNIEKEVCRATGK